MKIIIESTEVHTKSGTSTRTNKPYNIREQAAYLDLGKKFPVSCRIQLGDEQEPYQPGEYEAQTPLSVGRYESLQVSRDLGLRLIAAKPVRAAVG